MATTRRPAAETGRSRSGLRAQRPPTPGGHPRRGVRRIDVDSGCWTPATAPAAQYRPPRSGSPRRRRLRQSPRAHAGHRLTTGRLRLPVRRYAAALAALFAPVQLMWSDGLSSSRGSCPSLAATRIARGTRAPSCAGRQSFRPTHRSLRTEPNLGNGHRNCVTQFSGDGAFQHKIPRKIQALHSVPRSHLVPPSPGKSLPVRGFRSRSHTSYQAVTRNHTSHGPKHGPNTRAKNSLPIGVRHRQGAVLPKQPHRVMRLGRRCSNSENVRPDPGSQVHSRSSGRTTVVRESVNLLELLRKQAAGGDLEPPRECWRLQRLRGWDDLLSRILADFASANAEDSYAKRLGMDAELRADEVARARIEPGRTCGRLCTREPRRTCRRKWDVARHTRTDEAPRRARTRTGAASLRVRAQSRSRAAARADAAGAGVHPGVGAARRRG